MRSKLPGDEVAEILVHLRRRVCSNQAIEGNNIEGSEDLRQDPERKIWYGNFCERRGGSGNLGTYAVDVVLCSNRKVSVDVEDIIDYLHERHSRIKQRQHFGNHRERRGIAGVLV